MAIWYLVYYVDHAFHLREIAQNEKLSIYDFTMLCHFINHKALISEEVSTFLVCLLVSLVLVVGLWFWMLPFKLTISCSPSEAGVEGTVLDVPPLRIGDGTSLTYQPFSNLI